MGTLILLRHAESKFNFADRFAGRLDPPLTEKGRCDAHALGYKWRHRRITHIFTSPLQRAEDTARWINQSLAQCIVPEIDARLIERDYGDLSGMSRSCARKKYGDKHVRMWRRSFRTAPPSGESLADVQKRTSAWLKEKALLLVNGDACVLAVAHGNTIRALMFEIEGMNETVIEKLEVEKMTPIEYFFSSGTLIRKRT